MIGDFPAWDLNDIVSGLVRAAVSQETHAYGRHEALSDRSVFEALVVSTVAL